VNRETKIPLLVARIAGVVCAFPIGHVVETMRPGAVEDGMAMHRGERVPVVDAVTILGGTSAPKRCVVVRVGGSRASVLVDEVIGVERVEAESVIAMKAMFGAANLEGVASELRGVMASVRVMETEAARA
jgi:chemotaxis signal transduction protein